MLKTANVERNWLTFASKFCNWQTDCFFQDGPQPRGPPIVPRIAVILHSTIACFTRTWTKDAKLRNRVFKIDQSAEILGGQRLIVSLCRFFDSNIVVVAGQVGGILSYLFAVWLYRRRVAFKLSTSCPDFHVPPPIKIVMLHLCFIFLRLTLCSTEFLDKNHILIRIASPVPFQNAMEGERVLQEIANHIRKEVVAVPATLPPSFDAEFHNYLERYV